MGTSARVLRPPAKHGPGRLGQTPGAPGDESNEEEHPYGQGCPDNKQAQKKTDAALAPSSAARPAGWSALGCIR
jgi:hypothetical protein